MRLKHTLGFMSLVVVYTPTEMCETEEKVFYAKLDSVLDQYPSGHTHCPGRASSVLLLALRGLTASYVLVPMVLVPGTSTTLS